MLQYITVINPIYREQLHTKNKKEYTRKEKCGLDLTVKAQMYEWQLKLEIDPWGLYLPITRSISSLLKTKRLFQKRV